MDTPEAPKPNMANTRPEMEVLVQEGLARLNLARDALYLPVDLIEAIEEF
jgi:hypothetical protein